MHAKEYYLWTQSFERIGNKKCTLRVCTSK
jgi:hypothetical protein